MKRLLWLIVLLCSLTLTACTGTSTPTTELQTATPVPTQPPTPPPVFFDLTVNVFPEEGGSVSSQFEQLEEGSEIIVHAEEVIGYAFEQWSGDDDSRNLSITVLMDKDKEITANFVRVPSLVVSRTDVGIIDPSKLANALIDFDKDGDLDLIISGYHPDRPQPVLAFRNNGKGRFTNATEEVFAGYPVETTNARSIVPADFNGDGLEDIFIADSGDDYPGPIVGGQSIILMQTENGQLIDETKNRLPQQRENTRSIAVGDIDGDGDLDIYMCNLEHTVGPRFYINDGAGYFEEDTERIPSSISNRGKEYVSSLFVDIDNDEDLDLILGSKRGLPQDTILVNDGEGNFLEAPTNSLPIRLGGTRAQTISVSAADFDQDGWQDLVLSTHIDQLSNPKLQLLLNNSDGTFRDETQRIEQDWDSFPVSDCGTGGQIFIAKSHIVDSNNDGWPDILAQGAVCLMHLLFESSAGESFSIVDSYREYPPVGGYGPLLPGDIDNDGVMDVVLFYFANHFQTLLRVLPSDPEARREPVTWNPPDVETAAPEVTCIDETSMVEQAPNAQTTYLYRDDFEEGLAPGWNWIREEPDRWSLTENPGYLHFIIEPAYYHRNLLVRPAPEGNFEISTRVLFEPSGNFQFAGLMVYQDDDNYIQFGRAYCFFESNPNICPGNALYFDTTVLGEGGGCSNFATVTDIDSEAYLKIRREGSLYSAYYSLDGVSWILIGQHDIKFDPISIGIKTGQVNVPTTADFDFFLIETLP